MHGNHYKRCAVTPGNGGDQAIFPGVFVCFSRAYGKLSSSFPRRSTRLGYNAHDGNRSVWILLAFRRWILSNDKQSWEITGLVNAWREGEEGALDQLIELVHNELKIIARARLKSFQVNLNATAVVNEVYIKLVGIDPSRQNSWKNRHEFFALVSKVMLRFLLDEQKRMGRGKHGGDLIRVTLEPVSEDQTVARNTVDLLGLKKALEHFETLNLRQCRLWECRYLCGLSIAELSEAFEIGISTIHRELKIANGWIRGQLT